MIKAVFLDYSGTIAEDGGRDLEQMIARVVKNSKFKDAKSAVAWWFENLRVLEKNSCGESFLSEEDISALLLKMAQEEYQLKENHKELVDLNRSFWMYAPLFKDVKPFLEQCKLPVYIITNNSARYVNIFLKRNGLHVSGIITGDMVRAYKPHKELFKKALQTAGVSAKEALMIGDSLDSDIKGAKAAGMNAVLIDRKKKTETDRCPVIHDLKEALKLL